MKKIILLILLYSPASFAQTPKVSNDSIIDLMQRLPDAERLDLIQKNLLRFSDQYSSGTVMVIGGIIFTACSALVGNLIKDTDPKTGEILYPKGAVIGIYIGGATSLIGSIVLIDSHKFIRRAGGYRKPQPK